MTKIFNIQINKLICIPKVYKLIQLKQKWNYNKAMPMLNINFMKSLLSKWMMVHYIKSMKNHPYIAYKNSKMVGKEVVAI